MLSHSAKEAWKPDFKFGWVVRLNFLQFLLTFDSPWSVSSFLLPLACPPLLILCSSLSQVACRHFVGFCVRSSVKRTSCSGWPVRTTEFLLQRPKPVASTASLSTLMPRRRLVDVRTQSFISSVWMYVNRCVQSGVDYIKKAPFIIYFLLRLTWTLRPGRRCWAWSMLFVLTSSMRHSRGSSL